MLLLCLLTMCELFNISFSSKHFNENRIRFNLVHHSLTSSLEIFTRPKKKCGFPVSSYKNLGRVGRF
jgi:hypothetical protein